MNNVETGGVDPESDELLPEYDFSGGVRGKHHKDYQGGRSVVVHRADGMTPVQYYQGDGLGNQMATGATWATVIDYEERLRKDHDWAMDEGDRFFQRDDAIYKTLRKVAHRLDELEISYAVVGALALNAHGYRRLTVDIDLLVTREGLKAIHDHLERLGCVSPSTGSKKLRDTEHGVRIDFLVAGDYPGDGKPKPVAFPEPAGVIVERIGIKYLSLPSLIELKLASGITNPGRLKDLADVVELLKRVDLPAAFAEQLNPFVRAKFTEFWEVVQQGEREP